MLRSKLLFCNSHAAVKEEEDIMKQRKQKPHEFDLMWTKQPKNKTPKWLKKHWDMMQELEASPMRLVQL